MRIKILLFLLCLLLAATLPTGCARNDREEKADQTSSEATQSNHEADQDKDTTLPMVNIPQQTPADDNGVQTPDAPQDSVAVQPPVDDTDNPLPPEDGELELPIVPAN